MRAGQPKDVKAAQITTVILACNREHKYPVGDPRRDCHIGLTALDPEKCQWCVWFNTQTGKTSRLLTGGEAIALTGMLRSMRQSGEIELKERTTAESGIYYDAIGPLDIYRLGDLNGDGNVALASRPPGWP